MLSARGVKARPHDLDAMVALKPSLVELHCSAEDLAWTPSKRYNVPLAVHVPEFAVGELLDPASPDETKRARAEAVYVRAAARAAAWAPFFAGRPKVVFHPGGHVPGVDADDLQPPEGALLTALGKTVRAMQGEVGTAVEILVENLPATCWFYGGDWKARLMTSGRDLAAFCCQLGLGCTLDLCHLHLAAAELGLDASAEIRHALPWVRHIHYSDARYRNAEDRVVNQEGLQIGAGDMPLRRYFAALAPLADKKDLQVYAVPEVWFGHENAGAGFAQAWASLGQVLMPAGAGV